MENTTVLTLSRGYYRSDTEKNQPHASLANRSTSQQTRTNLPADKVSFSPEARQLAAHRFDTGMEGKSGGSAIPSQTTATGGTAMPPGAENMSSAELTKLLKLQKRDAEVRTHEQAHLSRAGQHAAGGASFSYTTGPDGVRYATAGEVPIDMSKEETPQETLDKMQQVKSAALAPATPSSADRRIAAKATVIAAQARQELQMESTGTYRETDSSHKTSDKTSPDTPQQPAPSENNGSQSKSQEFTTASRHMILQMYAVAQSQ